MCRMEVLLAAFLVVVQLQHKTNKQTYKNCKLVMLKDSLKRKETPEQMLQKAPVMLFLKLLRIINERLSLLISRVEDSA